MSNITNSQEGMVYMRRSRIYVMSFLLVFFIVLQSSSIGAYSIKNTSQNIEFSNITVLKPKLPVVGSYENLKRLIENHFKNMYRGFPNEKHIFI